MWRRLGLVALVGAACGSDPANDFLGTWHFDTGSQIVLACDSGDGDIVAPTGRIQLQSAKSHDLLMLDDFCYGEFYDVDGDRADLVLPVECEKSSTLDDGTDVILKTTFHADTLWLKDEQMMRYATFDFSEANTSKQVLLSCTMVMSATLSKGSE